MGEVSIEITHHTDSELHARRVEIVNDLTNITLDEVLERAAVYAVTPREDALLRELSGIDFLLGSESLVA